MHELIFEVSAKRPQRVDEPIGIVWEDRDKLPAGDLEELLEDQEATSPPIQLGVLTLRARAPRAPHAGGRGRGTSTPEVETQIPVGLIGLPEHFEGRHRLHVAGERARLVELVKKARDRYVVRVLRFGRIRRGLPAALCTLTDAQLRAVRTAHSLGYYEIPRRASTASVAQALKMHKGSAGEHLRRAERKVFDELLR